ncbi:hypothetical protein G9A89_002346 [Geosiphon pyriformis]|nr:hypothetical protein G9A89_002346 [Geosiphon pyriformis]
MVIQEVLKQNKFHIKSASQPFLTKQVQKIKPTTIQYFDINHTIRKFSSIRPFPRNLAGKNIYGLLYIKPQLPTLIPEGFDVGMYVNEQRVMNEMIRRHKYDIEHNIGRDSFKIRNHSWRATCHVKSNTEGKYLIIGLITYLINNLYNNLAVCVAGDGYALDIDPNGKGRKFRLDNRRALDRLDYMVDKQKEQEITNVKYEKDDSPFHPFFLNFRKILKFNPTFSRLNNNARHFLNYSK